jgi:hypothetical protein
VEGDERESGSYGSFFAWIQQRNTRLKLQTELGFGQGNENMKMKTDYWLETFPDQCLEIE